MGKVIGRFSNILDQKYPHQHSRNLFYLLQLLTHHLKVIRQENLFHINLIIKTLLQLKTITTPLKKYDINSCEKPIKQNYSVESTS